MKNLTFLCIGSATQDVFLSQSDDLEPVCDNPAECFFRIELGDKINVNKIDFSTGGGASNAATTFARHGFSTMYMGVLGRDPASDFVMRALDDEHVDTRFVSYNDRMQTNYSTILLAPDGERTILMYRGSVLLKKSDFDLDKVFEQGETPDWIYITGLEARFEIYDELFRKAKQHGINIAFNPGTRELEHPEKLRALLHDVDILTVNKDEAQKIVNGTTSDELLRHLRNYCPTVLVTDGRKGAIAGDKTSVVTSGLYDVKKPIDATGAGDAFGSGFVVKYAQGSGVADAVHFASANASSVVQFVGAKTGVLTGQELLKPMELEIRPTNY